MIKKPDMHHVYNINVEQDSSSLLFMETPFISEAQIWHKLWMEAMVKHMIYDAHNKYQS